MNPSTLDLTANLIDTRDIIARYEELCDSVTDEGDSDAAVAKCEENADEVDTLRAILSDLAGNGGDEQWEGEWYPGQLVRGSHFKRYAMELAEDTGMIDETASWPHTCIDWEKAARELQMDYTSAEIEGATYYFQ